MKWFGHYVKCLVFHWLYFFLSRNLSKAQRDCFIASTINEVYDDITQLDQTEEHVYDVIDVSGNTYTKASFTGGTDKNPCLSYPLLTISPIVLPPTYENVGVAREGEEEVVYDTVPCDQWLHDI